MLWFVLALILLLGGLGGVVASRFVSNTSGYSSNGTPRTVTLIIGSAVALIGLVVLLISPIRSVPVKSVGVATAFGKVEGFLAPGIHYVAPWKVINILPETIQTTTFEGSNGCLDVRIGGQQQACLDVAIQWQIKDSAADSLFKNYDTSGTSVLANITNAVVVRELKVAVNQTMGDYNPIADISSNGQSGNSQFSTFGPAVEKLMNSDIGSEISIHSVLIPFLHYDASTQARLNSIQQQYGDTAIAQQSIKTNQAQSAANAAISASVANNPAVLAQECLTIVQLAAKTGYSLPAGFNCFGGSSNLALAVK